MPARLLLLVEIFSPRVLRLQTQDFPFEPRRVELISIPVGDVELMGAPAPTVEVEYPCDAPQA
jgi:hypothetical protein